MFITLGIILIIVAIAMIVLNGLSSDKDEFIGEGYNRKQTKYKSPDFILKWNKKISYVIIVFGIFIMMLPYLFFMAEEGFNYYVQYPTGKYKVHTEKRGVTWRGFGKVTGWKDFVSVTTDVDPDDSNASGVFNPITIRFSDKVTGKQRVTARFELPDDAEIFRNLVKEFRTLDNLIKRTLIPTVEEVVSNSPYMFTGQGYASGEAPDYKYAVRDQLTNGSYVLEDKKGISIASEKLLPDSLKTVGGIDDNQILTKQPKLGSNGTPLRLAHAISKSGIKVTQVTLPDVDFHDSFDTKLEEQRKQSAKIQEFAIKEKAMISESKYEKAQGEKLKIVEQMAQEKAAVKKIIAMQTKLQEDSIRLQQTKVSKEIAKVSAQEIKITADAEAYKTKKNVAAGISPEVELGLRLNAQVKIEAERAKTKWPVYYMPGVGESGGSIDALISAGMAKQLGNIKTTGGK